ncbi:hypothetical protein IUJ58_02275 [Priestia aryabhattai]|uniref:hypothetical protein n=1 Tax=Priestia aryabhattai TaxID=412384 RepID=UPI002377E8BE|nr:hypothetical protein [Priestia aryabhattai]WDL87739.1 hypothetical protein IUJ58_02275 [Priestia aryabhattai]
MASGIGRLGGILGLLLGSFYYLSISLPIQLNFIAFAILGPSVAVALAFFPARKAYYKKQEANVSEVKEVKNA